MPNTKTNISFAFHVLQAKVKNLKKQASSTQPKVVNSLKKKADLTNALNNLEKQFESVGLDTSLIPPMRNLSEEAVACVESNNGEALASIVSAMDPVIKNIEAANITQLAEPAILYFERPALSSTPFFKSYGGYTKTEEEENKMLQEDALKAMTARHRIYEKLPKPLPASFYDKAIIESLGTMLLKTNTVLSSDVINNMDINVRYTIGAYFLDNLSGLSSCLPEYISTYLVHQLILQHDISNDNHPEYKNAQSIFTLKNNIRNYADMKKLNNLETITRMLTPNKESIGFIGYIQDCQMIARALIHCFGEKYRELDQVGVFECAEEKSQAYGTKVFNALSENRLAFAFRPNS